MTEIAPEKESLQDSYKNYADYNAVLRTWFVSFGLGALVLFMLHPDFVTLLTARGHFSLIVTLFLVGCFGQIVVALINKFSSWHIYDAAKKGMEPGKVTAFWYSAFWVDKLIDMVTVACFVFAIGLMVLDFVVTAPPAQDASTADLALVTRCSEGAAKLYQRLGYSNQPLASYKNHWNKKRGKCFVQITASSKELFMTIDVYDAFENKRYAEFNGHQFCNSVAAGSVGCKLNSATIWLDGNDDREKGDYELGFGGIGKGRVGDADTRTEFLARVLPLMSQ